MCRVLSQYSCREKIMNLTKEQLNRYHRQIFMPSIGIEGQEALLEANVLIVGLGGLGNVVAQYLSGAGVGELTLIDFDDVAESNLHRQVLYDEADIGKSKVEAASKHLKEKNSATQVNAIHHRYNEAEHEKYVLKASIVVDCTDNLVSRNALASACFKAKKILICGSAIRFEGQLFTQLVGDDMPCYQCLSSQFSQPSESCIENGVAGPVVGIIGCAQALAVIKCLSGAGDVSGQELQLFDGLSSEWTKFQLKKSSSCPLCA